MVAKHQQLLNTFLETYIYRDNNLTKNIFNFRNRFFTHLLSFVAIWNTMYHKWTSINSFFTCLLTFIAIRDIALMQKGKHQQIFYIFLVPYSNQEHILMHNDDNQLHFHTLFEFCRGSFQKLKYCFHKTNTSQMALSCIGPIIWNKTPEMLQ